MYALTDFRMILVRQALSLTVRIASLSGSLVALAAVDFPRGVASEVAEFEVEYSGAVSIGTSLDPLFAASNATRTPLLSTLATSVHPLILESADSLEEGVSSGRLGTDVTTISHDSLTFHGTSELTACAPLPHNKPFSCCYR
jgi:hypothetical protein